MQTGSQFPVFPRFGFRLLEPLPPAPLTLLLGAVVRGVAARHSRLFTRLGPHAGKRFLIDPSDLPVVFLLRPRMDGPAMEAYRRSAPVTRDCRIAGPLAALLGLVHGTMDGDALFFSRDIVMEGDTEAALALRNALDDAELDLFAEVAAALGGPGTAAAARLRPLTGALSRLTGVALTRPEAVG